MAGGAWFAPLEPLVFYWYAIQQCLFKEKCTIGHVSKQKNVVPKVTLQ